MQSGHLTEKNNDANVKERKKLQTADSSQTLAEVSVCATLKRYANSTHLPAVLIFSQGKVQFFIYQLPLEQ